MATARRRTVSLAAAALAFVGALAVGFGAGYVVRKVTTTTTSTSTSTSTTSTSSSTTTSIAPLAACVGGTFTARLASSQGAAGTVQAVVQLTNRGAASCRLRGYPSVILLTSNATPLPTTTVKGQASFSVAAANAAPGTERVTAGGTTSFMLQYSQIPTGTQTTCPTASSLNAYVPASATPVNVVATLAPCDAGTVYVSPFYGAT